MVVQTEAGRADLELEAVEARGRVVEDLLDDGVLTPEVAAGTNPHDLREVRVVGVLCAVAVRVVVAFVLVRQPALACAVGRCRTAIELAVQVAVAVCEPGVRPLHDQAVVDVVAGRAPVRAVEAPIG